MQARTVQILFLGALFAGRIGPAGAEEVAVAVNIPTQPLAAALRQLADQTGMQLVYEADLARGLKSPAVKGRLSAQEALKRMLDGTGLQHEFLDQRTVAVTAPPAKKSQATDVVDAPIRLAQAAVPPATAAATAAANESAGPPPVQSNPTALELTEVIVTGSRISRPALDSSVPVTAFSREEVLESGHTSLADVLVEAPGVDYDVSPTNSQTATHASGLSTINLRNLGANRALVLIDGRRTVSNSASSNRVSLDTIPADMVERVEIMTGGASAVYGSDAVAGVVNVITESDFEGVRSSVRVGELTDGGNEEREATLTAASRFAADRLYGLVALSWDEQTGLRANERDWSQTPVAFSSSTNTLTDPSLSSSTPGGRFSGTRFFYNDAGLQRNFVTARDGYNDRPFGTLIIPRERMLASAKLDYSLSENTRAFVQGQFASVETNAPRRPDAMSSADLAIDGATTAPGNGRIPLSNPLIPADIRADAIARRQTSVDFNRRFTEVGIQERKNDRDTVRAWAGFDGTIADNWNWEVSYGYGRFDFVQQRTNGIHLPRLRNALDAETDPANPSVVRCRSAAARAEGCVPINLFGIGTITGEAAAYIRVPALYDGMLRQDVVAANASGSLFDLPAGPLSIAFGAEYRKEQEDVVADALSESGETSFTPIPPIKGDFNVKEVFVEAVVPLLAEKPFAYRLGAEAAVRVADYSQPNVDKVASFKVGANWAPIPDIRLRAQFARAQRAPDITELFSPERGDFDDVADPCNGITAASTGSVAQNCRAIPEIAAQIAAAGAFQQESEEIYGPNSGNPELAEETADTITTGLIFTPRFAPRLSATFDYYKIEIEDAIGAVDSQIVLDECYGASSGFPDNKFCNVVTRDADGQIARIVNQSENLTLQVSEGIDASLDYSFDLDAVRTPGTIDLSLLYSHILDLEEVFTGTDGTAQVNDQVGQIGTFEDRWRASLGWSYEGWRFRWRAKYYSEAADSNSRKEFFAERGVTDPLFLYVPSYTTHDVYMHYEFGQDTRIRISAGVNNLFNEISPFLPSGTDSGGTNNFNGVYDIGGRFVYGQVRVTF